MKVRSNKKKLKLKLKYKRFFLASPIHNYVYLQNSSHDLSKVLAALALRNDLKEFFWHIYNLYRQAMRQKVVYLRQEA